ncbi:MAG: branched-chain amino acid ABC transporter permease [Anaerolineae bacterium]
MAQRTLEPGKPAAPSIDWRQFGTYVAYAIAIILLMAWLGPLAADKPPYRLVQSTITGLLVGGIYALVALGIVIINKASGVFNFAHGYMMLTSALLFYSFFSNSTVNIVAAGIFAALTVMIVISMDSWRSLLNVRNMVIGAVAAAILTFLMTLRDPDLRLIRALVGGLVGAVFIGLVVERYAIRPLIGQPLFTAVLMTLAVGEVLHGLTLMIWGSVDIPLRIFAGVTQLGIPMPTIRIDASETFLDGRIIINSQLLIAFILALIAFAAFVAFFRYTNVGLAMRATAENQQLAQSVGMRVRFILAVAWAIAALLAMTAGVLQGGATSLSQYMPLIALSAFPAVLLGGLESIGGALVGGLIIGLTQEWANLLFPGTQAGTEFAPYVVLMVVLIIRPDGLFGQKRIERI